jgi:hypothetical protein
VALGFLARLTGATLSHVSGLLVNVVANITFISILFECIRVVVVVGVILGFVFTVAINVNAIIVAIISIAIVIIVIAMVVAITIALAGMIIDIVIVANSSIAIITIVVASTHLTFGAVFACLLCSSTASSLSMSRVTSPIVIWSSSLVNPHFLIMLLARMSTCCAAILRGYILVVMVILFGVRESTWSSTI